jgi:hypothetical protein
LKGGRFDLARSRDAVLPLMSVLGVLLAGSSLASADDLVTYPEPGAIYVVLLPMVGAIVLLLVALPPLLGRPYWRERPSFHLANTVATTSLVTLLMALFVFYLLYEVSGSRTYPVAAFAAFSTFLLTGVLARYLLMPLPWATVSAVALACVMVVMVRLASDASNDGPWRAVEGLLHLLPLLLLTWLGVLAWETARFHYVEGATHEEPGGPRLPRRRRMLRLGEMLIANMAVATGLLLVLPS